MIVFSCRTHHQLSCAAHDDAKCHHQGCGTAHPASPQLRFIPACGAWPCRTGRRLPLRPPALERCTVLHPRPWMRRGRTCQTMLQTLCCMLPVTMRWGPVAPALLWMRRLTMHACKSCMLWCCLQRGLVIRMASQGISLSRVASHREQCRRQKLSGRTGALATGSTWLRCAG